VSESGTMSVTVMNVPLALTITPAPIGRLVYRE